MYSLIRLTPFLKFSSSMLEVKVKGCEESVSLSSETPLVRDVFSFSSREFIFSIVFS